MSPGGLITESLGEVTTLRAYICDQVGCHRCYSETSGYFDFIKGKPYVSRNQMICKRDARAMFLESVTLQDDTTWRCPECSGTIKT